jgi:hypothetical protein
MTTVWPDKIEEIAGTVNALSAGFHPVLHAGWLAYINTTYAPGKARKGPAACQRALVVAD